MPRATIKRSGLLALGLASLLCNALPGAAHGAREVESSARCAATGLLARVQAFYGRQGLFSADFRQARSLPVVGTQEVHTGEIRVRQPGIMLWRYDDDRLPTVYVYGQRSWLCDRLTSCAPLLQGDTLRVAKVLDLIFGREDPNEHFRVRVAPRDAAFEQNVLELMPRQRELLLKRVRLVVDTTSGRIDEVELVGPAGARLSLEVTNQSWGA